MIPSRRPNALSSMTSPDRPGSYCTTCADRGAEGEPGGARASRQRLVEAQDEKQRRLERNLHDEAQQQLVALSVKLRLAEQLVERDAAKTRGLLAQLQGDATSPLEDLRDLARGIYPPLLADNGFGGAIEAQGTPCGGADGGRSR